MANNNENKAKKGGPAASSPTTSSSSVAPAPKNVYATAGNQQISEVIESQKKAAPEASLLTKLDTEAEQSGSEQGVSQEQAPSWAKGNATVEKEDEVQVAKRPDPEKVAKAAEVAPAVKAAEAPAAEKVAKAPEAAVEPAKKDDKSLADQAAAVALAAQTSGPEAAAKAAGAQGAEAAKKATEEALAAHKEPEEEAQVATRQDAGADQKAEKKPAKDLSRPKSAAAIAMVSQADGRHTATAADKEGLAQKNTDGEKLLAVADDKQVAAVDRARQVAGQDLTESQVMLAMAESGGMDESAKASMVLEQGKDVGLEELEGQSGELRALIVAEQLPPALAGFARAAAIEAAESPLSERETLKNLTDQILEISQQMSNHTDLTDPKISVEEKATRLVEKVAYELDIPTRESVAVHPFQALLEDMIFDPNGVMEINRVAGSRRDVRTIGSFGVVLWQLAHDAMTTRLENLDDKKQVNEAAFLSDVYGDMAKRMYTDAMAKPSGA